MSTPKKRRNRQGRQDRQGRKGTAAGLRPFSLLIKPAGPDCNLRCDYCFYLCKHEIFPPSWSGAAGADGTGAEPTGTGVSPAGAHRMSDETLEALVRSFLATPQRQYIFNWQGGEPTLMGLDFFRRVVELQRRNAPSGASVVNTLQTNATLIDDEWAQFLAEYSFLTGVSLDGPQEIHDSYRRDAAGRGSFDRVMAGVEHLRGRNAEFNILSMVTSRSAARRIWSFFLDQGFFYQQYIPCVEFDEHGEPLSYTVDAEGWGSFLGELFELWHPGHVRRVSVRNFDNLINFLATGEFSSCTMRGACDQYFVVEHDGGVYPCDFFVEPQYRLGSVLEKDWRELQSSPVYRAFGAQKSRWNEACAGCEYLDYCSGDCLKMRFRGRGPRDTGELSYLCAGHRRFLSRALPRLTELARVARREVLGLDAEAQLPPVARGTDGPCFCGSGKHYRNCHMPIYSRTSR